MSLRGSGELTLRMSLRVVSGELTLQDGGERGRARADAAGAVDVEGARLLRAAAVAHEDPAGRADDRMARAPGWGEGEGEGEGEG